MHQEFRLFLIPGKVPRQDKNIQQTDTNQKMHSTVNIVEIFSEQVKKFGIYRKHLLSLTKYSENIL